MDMRHTSLIFSIVLAFCLPGFGTAATCDAANQPRLLLTAVGGGATCRSDPIAQCLSDFSLELLDDQCSMKPNRANLPDAAATVRLQKRWDAGSRIKRNAMDAVFPFIGEEAYTTCVERVGNLSDITGTAIDSMLATMFNAVDTLGVTSQWAVANLSASSFQVTHAATGCRLTYSVLVDGFDKYEPLVAGVPDASLTLADGMYAELVDANTNPQTFIAAFCPAGTYSARPAVGDKTSRTDCDTMPAGYASNGVGATMAKNDSMLCPAGTFAREGAAMCMPCDEDTYAPFKGMWVCAECVEGYAPVQGSPRCFAGFAGRVIVTEGQSMGTVGKIYDPSRALSKIYGEAGAIIEESAIFPDGYTNYTATDNTDDKVPDLGTPMPGWAVIRFDATPTINGIGIDFMTRCVTTTTRTAAVQVTEVAVATLSMLGSVECSQMNGVVVDLSGTVPATFTSPAPNWQNLTLRYASPGELVAFGLTASVGTALLHVHTVSGAVKFTALADSTASAAVAAQYERGMTVLANTFAGDIQAVGMLCPAGTVYSEVANAAGVTYSRQCKPCPTGNYCPQGAPGMSPTASQCPAGTRGIVFGATNSTLHCIPCKAGYYQGTPASMTCDRCTPAEQGATTCPLFCKDGTEGDPLSDEGCTPCPPGSYRNGNDMPNCVTCPPGNDIRVMNASGVDVAIDGNLDSGGEVCVPCDPGYANDFQINNKCTKCNAGSYSPRGGQAVCISCAKGTWQNASAATACVQAKRGTYIDVVGATANNVSCPVGYEGRVAGAVSFKTGCDKCRPGGFSNTTGAVACIPCTAGRYQDKSAQTSCVTCPAGTVNTKIRSESCTICAPGSYSIKGSTLCVKCSVGTYQDRAKQSGCKACPVGSFCPQAGMVAPIKCPAGTFNPRPNGSSQRLACLPCAKAAAGASKC